ncbi:fatty acid cis/trans isomerase [Alteromonas lipolytica]|uniref:9-hexadecenoic acid cis-trans isomerase n=1 Tax=Alteromonas lipolytica TaxID=1856405 RepID=A0A1E8F900_9ALTE|nr:fatty acid cis/trans isomerase [Alteromonas lipolytica]OFI32399.1 hypothetical protein BFC17_06695 [Alteromonas lipolytica]GGF79999.1 9-hexadecenoic acid cis-trans isomerase [Alteromonas lipolytica]
MRVKSKFLWLFTVVAVAGCTYGFVDPQALWSVYDNPPTNEKVNYTETAKPILDKRCVVCHACYDAPCQLKLGSYEGITRGANKKPVYHGDRLLADNPTRLFIDARSPGEWRGKGFYPVLDEISEFNDQLNNSVLASMLALKRSHPTNDGQALSDEFEFDINRDMQCPTIGEFPAYQQDHSQWGMPYGLPAIDMDEHNLLMQWLQAGAPTSEPAPIASADQKGIEQWEAFFNQDSLKQQLVSRYLYEHLFISHIYFEDRQGNTQYWSLQRALTPPGQPFTPVATVRPFGSPFETQQKDTTQRVYYRFMPVKNTIVAKLHMPIELNQARMQKWQKWFFEPDYQVTSLPGYEPEIASNPFVAFAQIPVASRYRFMLDESQHTIMQFIKGPVCRGQIALNVINDHFWVMFLNPTSEILDHQGEFLSESRKIISMPAEAESNALPTNWISYARQEHEYLTKRSEYLASHALEEVPLDLNIIWQGDGDNDNAGLTIVRHYDAATVVKGFLGERPQTAWLITYPLFERIHYLLVAGYDVYGNVGHQLNSRIYMDFLRMEGEFNFLALLPKESREKVREHWYRGNVSSIEKYLAEGNQINGESAVKYTSDDHLSQLYQKVRAHLSGVLSKKHDIDNGFTDNTSKTALHSIQDIVGIPASLLPQSSILLVEDARANEQHIYTLLSNNAYTNISHFLAEDARRLPEEDTLTLSYGFATAHPNAIFYLQKEQLEAFRKSLAALNNEQDLQALFEAYGVRRTAPDFWQVSDKIHNWYQQTYPLEFGYLDYNRLINW